MARVAAGRREDLAEFDELFQGIEASGNVVPNSMLTMGRNPALLQAYAPLNAVIYGSGVVSADLKRLVAHVASRAAGCQYCAAHNGLRASNLGVEEQKIEAIWDFESSPLFSAAERSALQLARAAGQIPNEATQAHFDELRRHFDDAGILELVAVIAMTGFTNRWNDTLRTEFEEAPLAFATAHLAAHGT